MFRAHGGGLRPSPPAAAQALFVAWAGGLLP